MWTGLGILVGLGIGAWGQRGDSIVRPAIACTSGALLAQVGLALLLASW